ncbi:hypothetical protein [Saccharicrinis aurantiacus]|uniref:hypothetical protein n=1 Tax=Saccharicrinis aurantiacus TaxID=1849719 RepID=UPI00083903F9|nr:hypothetical protein [Saccharicrinis aurantiacus]
MKHLIKGIVVAFVLMVSINTYAEELKPKQKQKVEASVNEMTEIMGLDADQKAKMLVLKTEQEKARIAIVAKYEKGEERTAAIKEMYAQYGKKQRAIVTPEQQKKWKNRPRN